jgi:hypothetical protein
MVVCIETSSSLYTPDRLLGGITEHVVRPSIPKPDPALECQRNEWVRRFFEEQLGKRFACGSSLMIGHSVPPG